MKFPAGEDCGFVETAEGREIFFHRNRVRDDAFDRLVVGAEVRFVEKTGEKGAHGPPRRQASHRPTEDGRLRSRTRRNRNAA